MADKCLMQGGRIHGQYRNIKGNIYTVSWWGHNRRVHWQEYHRRDSENVFDLYKADPYLDRADPEQGPMLKMAIKPVCDIGIKGTKAVCRVVTY